VDEPQKYVYSADEEAAADPVHVPRDDLLRRRIAISTRHFRVRHGVGVELGRKRECEARCVHASVGQISEQTDVQPAEVARSERVRAHRHPHYLVLGVHGCRVVGYDRVGRVEWIVRAGEDLGY